MLGSWILVKVLYTTGSACQSMHPVAYKNVKIFQTFKSWNRGVLEGYFFFFFHRSIIHFRGGGYISYRLSDALLRRFSGNSLS